MRKSAFVALALCLAPFAASAEAPVPKPSFDCAKAGTVVERTLCSNFELAALDSTLAARYSHVRKHAEYTKDDIRNAQRAWVVDRNKCNSVTGTEDRHACIGSAYITRLIELELDHSSYLPAMPEAANPQYCANEASTYGMNSCLGTYSTWTETAVQTEANKLRAHWQEMAQEMPDTFNRSLTTLDDTLRAFPSWQSTRCGLDAQMMAGGTGESTMYIGCAINEAEDLLKTIVQLRYGQ
ncbi:MAG: hypothetical protein Alpg2KO_09740 [Alphaproteobacteria bacterium]